mmetsp:Transcript_2033/g.4645  ORF Transcript_2033/g.4645 Transcript_2033/m.4645 type:complete len:178 (-) Transcript_2033:2401-2934(-)
MEKHRSKESLVIKARQEVSSESYGSKLVQRGKKRSKEDLMLQQINEEDNYKPSPRLKVAVTKRKPLKPQQLYDSGYDMHVSGTSQVPRNIRPNLRRNELPEAFTQESVNYQSTRQLPHIYSTQLDAGMRKLDSRGNTRVQRDEGDMGGGPQYEEGIYGFIRPPKAAFVYEPRSRAYY